jgi:hypothetical protein
MTYRKPDPAGIVIALELLELSLAIKKEVAGKCRSLKTSKASSGSSTPLKKRGLNSRDSFLNWDDLSSGLERKN